MSFLYIRYRNSNASQYQANSTINNSTASFPSRNLLAEFMMLFSIRAGIDDHNLGDSLLEVIQLKRLLMFVSIILIMAVLFMPVRTHAEIKANPVEVDSDLYPDMLILMLLPQVQEAVNTYYSKILTVEPVVYPYEIDILMAARANQNPNNRDYDFIITLEVQPVIGPHIAVGKDRITLELSPLIPNTVKIKSYSHIETNELPPNWQHILR